MRVQDATDFGVLILCPAVRLHWGLDLRSLPGQGRDVCSKGNLTSSVPSPPPLTALADAPSTGDRSGAGDISRSPGGAVTAAVSTFWIGFLGDFKTATRGRCSHSREEMVRKVTVALPPPPRT